MGRVRGQGMDTMQSVGGFDGGAGIAGRGGARQFKVDRVYLALKQAIVAGELAPMALVEKANGAPASGSRGCRSQARLTGSPSRAWS